VQEFIIYFIAFLGFCANIKLNLSFKGEFL